MVVFVFFFKQKTAYEMRISDWSSDVCSSDLKRDFRIDALLEGPALPIPEGLAGVLVPGTMVSEAVFFHPASRTVILTDLIENFEIGRASCRERVCQYV